MSAFELYSKLRDVSGNTKRETVLNREARYINSKVPDNLSYTSVLIHPSDYSYNLESDDAVANTFSMNVSIINSDNLDEKTILSMPGEDIELGSIVDWMGQHWLVAERDANTTIYTKCKLQQCNYLLKWIIVGEDGAPTIIEQWSVVEDGTKLTVIASVWCEPYDKRPIELLGTPYSQTYYNVMMKYA